MATTQTVTMSSLPATDTLVEAPSRPRDHSVSREEEPEGPPDGGFVAWAQVVTAHIANAVSWGYGAGFGVFQLHYRQTMDLPSSQVSWIGSTQMFFLFVLGIVSGRIADSGHTRAIFLVGSMLLVLGIFMTSLATEYWQILLAQGVCTGVGGGLIFIPTSANVGIYFEKKRMLALSLVACGTSTGAIVYPVLVQHLMPRFGFPWAVRVCGFVTLALCAVGFTLLKPRRLPKRPAPMVDLSAFKYRPFSIFSLGAFLILFSNFTMIIYLNSFARESIGLSDLESVNFLIIFNCVSLVARPLFGFLADRYLGPINTFGLGSLGVAILAFGWMGVKSRVGMYVFSCFVGVVNSASQGMFSGAISGLVTDMSKMGTWMGMVYGLCGLATLAGPPIMGAIIDASSGDYLWALLWTGMVVLVGSCFVLATPYLIKRKGTNKV